MKHVGTRRIETERLLLRPLTISDSHAMYHNWTSSDAVSRYVTWETHANPQETAELLTLWSKAYEQPDFYTWGMEIKATGELIGTFAFVTISERDELAELGYCIGEPWWHQGYVTEAGKALLDLGFEEIGLNRIQAVHNVDNPASGRVMEKLGMTYEGIMRDVRKVKGQFVSLACYALLAKDR